MVIIWEIVSALNIILTIIGAVSSIIFLHDRYGIRKKIGWKFVQKTVKGIVAKLKKDGFSPTLIVGLGRGGAIIGSLISGLEGHIPLIVIDTKYEWREGIRFEHIFSRLIDVENLKEFSEKMLLVTGEVHSGATMRVNYKYFQKLGAKEIKTVAFYYEKDSTFIVNYKGFISDKKDIRLPWMLSDDYKRTCRRETRPT